MAARRRTAAAGLATAPDRGARPSPAVRQFQEGLLPILIAGDVAAFRRYLAQWEEVIGDTSDLAARPVDEQRRLMADLLRRPQQFNLPPWPAALAPGRQPDRQVFSERPEPGHQPDGRAWPPAPAPAAPSGRPARPERPGVRQQNTAGGAAEAGCEAPGYYQLDMLTGELVPVAPSRPAVAEGSAAYGEEARRAPRRAPRRRRPLRAVGISLHQLSLWPDPKASTPWPDPEPPRSSA